MNLSGKWKIKTNFNEQTGKTTYRTVLVNKTIDGTPTYASVFIDFVGNAKDKPIENDMWIEVKPENAWLSFYKTIKDGKEIVTFNAKVKDFEISEQEQADYTDFGGEDLPF